MTPHPTAITVETAMTTRGPRSSDRHHSVAVRPEWPRATTSATHAQIRPSRRGRARAAQPKLVSQAADDTGRAPPYSSPAQSASPPLIAIAEGLTLAKTDHAIGVTATSSAAAPSGRRGVTSHRALATSATASAAPPIRAHQIGARPGRRLSRPPGRCPQIGYSPALDGNVTVAFDTSAAGAQLTGTAGWWA